MLIEIADAKIVLPFDLPFVLYEFARYDIDKGGLSRSVQSDHADVFAVADRKIGMHEQVAVVVAMRKPFDFQSTHKNYSTI